MFMERGTRRSEPRRESPPNYSIGDTGAFVGVLRAGGGRAASAGLRGNVGKYRRADGRTAVSLLDDDLVLQCCRVERNRASQRGRGVDRPLVEVAARRVHRNALKLCRGIVCLKAIE